MDALNKFKSRAINPMKPNTRGTAENDDIYFECTGKAGDKISQVGIYETKVLNRITQNEEFQKKVSGEFYLPVYELEKEFAELHLFNVEKNDIPVKIQVTLNEYVYQLHIGPRQIKGLTLMSNYFKKTFMTSLKK